MRQAADLRQRHNHALHELRRREQEYARLQDHLRELLGERVRCARSGPPSGVVEESHLRAQMVAAVLIALSSLGGKCRYRLRG